MTLSEKKRTYSPFWKILDSRFWLCCITIVLFALAIRLISLGKVPFSLYWDEAAMYVDIKAVLATGQDMHGRPWYQLIYPSYGDYKLPMYIWSATLASKILGLSEFSVRLPSVLAGVGTVMIAGAIMYELQLFQAEKYRRLGVLLVMLVIAISPWSVLFSRTGFEGHLGQFLMATSIWCVLRSRRLRWYLVPAVLLAALATYTYFSVRFVWIGVYFLSEGMVLLALSKMSVFKKLAIFILPILAFSVLLIPMMRSPLYQDSNTFRLGTDSVLNNQAQILQSNVYRELAGNTVIDRVIFHRWWLTARELLTNYSDHLSLNFLFVAGDPNLRHGMQVDGLFPLLFLPFFFLGWFYLFKGKPFVFVLLIGWWMLALLPASVPQNTPHALRSLNALVPLSLVIGVGITYFFKWSAARLPNLGRMMLWSALIASLLFSTGSFLFYYFTVYPITSASDWQDGYASLATAIFQHKKAGEQVYIHQFDDRFYLWLMGYGSFSGSEFRTWKSKGYKFEEAVPEIQFGGASLSEAQQKKKFVWYVAEDAPADKDESSRSATAQLARQIIYGSDGKTPRYYLVKLGL